MNKPEVKTDWAVGDTAKKVDPLESQRQSGWVYQEAPSASIFNHWMNAVHQWQRYLEANDDESDDRIDALIAVAQHQTQELQRLNDWLEKIQKHLESHTAPSQPPPPKPNSTLPPPSMPTYKWEQINKRRNPL